jgi:hypothetical protein
MKYKRNGTFRLIISLVQKRKRERPQNNTPALIKQPSEAYNKQS